MRIGREYEQSWDNPRERECDREWAHRQKSSKTCLIAEKNKNIDEDLDAVAFHHVHVIADDREGIENVRSLPRNLPEENRINIQYRTN